MPVIIPNWDCFYLNGNAVALAMVKKQLRFRLHAVAHCMLECTQARLLIQLSGARREQAFTISAADEFISGIPADFCRTRIPEENSSLRIHQTHPEGEQLCKLLKIFCVGCHSTPSQPVLRLERVLALTEERVWLPATQLAFLTKTPWLHAWFVRHRVRWGK